MARVAVIVVPGVGDDAPGDTLEAVTRALVARPDVAGAEVRRSLISPEAGDAPYDLRWAQVHPADDAGPNRPPDMDVFEMTWSDISRFPGGLLRFFRTFVSLLSQVSTIGIEALRPWAKGSSSQSASTASRLLAAVSTTLVYPILVVGILLAGHAGLLLAALMLDDHVFWWRAVLVVGGLATVVLAAAVLRTRVHGGWFAGVGTVFVLLVATRRATRLFVDDADSATAVAIANDAIILGSVVFRGLWLIAVALAAAAVVSLAIFVLNGPAEEATARARAAFTALVSLAAAPIGVALTGAVVFASFAAIGLQSLSGGWGGAPDKLLCTSDPGSFFPRACDTVPAPTDWALALLSQIAQPLVWALIIGIVPGLLLLGAVAAFAEPWLEARFGKGADKEVRLGDTLTSVLRFLTGALTTVVLGLAIIAGAAVTFWVWLIDDLPGFGSLQLGGISALSISGLVLVTRLLAVGPRSTFGPLRGLLKRLRIVLDLPYDVATYLRVDPVGVTKRGPRPEPPRELMLRRYRALLAHVADGGNDGRAYDGLVIASHSQGTVLTVAALAGDSFREPVAEPLSTTRPGLGLPSRVSLLMFGSPLGQLYATRFPKQFGQFGPDGPLAWRPGAAGATDMWVNVYRAADPVGRALWAPEFVGANDPQRLRFAACWLGGPEVREACLPGTAGHTGYWGDARVVDYLVYLTRRAVGGDPTWPGPERLQ